MAIPTRVSAAFFSPQSRAPTTEYLNGLHSFLEESTHGKILLQHVATLGSIWPIWTAAQPDLRVLHTAQKHVDKLVHWASGGPSSPVAEARTGIIALPLLLVVQLGQYFRYLEFHSISHNQFITDVRDAGGIQGCCGGEPAALSIACAKDEAHVVENAAVFLRIVVAMGGLIEALADGQSSEATIVALRLKYEGQEKDLMQKFPGTYVSAITEPRSLSLVGSAESIARLFEYASQNGLPADKMDVTGKGHNPENAPRLPAFLKFLDTNPLFRLPEKSKLQVPVRSNRTGEQVWDDTFMEDMVIMMMASCCDWYKLLTRVAEALKATNRPSHHLVIFGLGDSAPLLPFNKQRLKISKFQAQTLILEKGSSSPIAISEILTSTNAPKLPAYAIAVVGVSCRLPGANNLDELWDLLSSSRDTHQEVPKDRFDINTSSRVSQDNALKDKKFFGNFIDDVKRFDNIFFGVNAKEAASMDPQQRMLLECSFEALDSSGYLASHIRETGDSVGCFIGNSVNDYLDNVNSHPPSAYTATGTIRAFLSGRLSHYYGWIGPSEVLDTACSSSLVAINRACYAIQTGQCKMALAGGVSAMTGVNGFLDLAKAGFLSHTGQCKPFDAAADGYCRSEGAGLVVLKKVDDAISQGDNILGVIAAIGSNQGGLSSSLTIPSASALESLYTTVIDQSGFQPSEISFVETHGTGTQAGDPIEIESIQSVLGKSSRSIPLSIGSIKGNIGHCESAAGVAGLLKVLAMIKHRGIPPQPNHKESNPKFRPLEEYRMEISKDLRSWDDPLRVALVNSYGAAGSNCALVCCELPAAQMQEKKLDILGHSLPLPIFLSAASKSSLELNARVFQSYLSKNQSSLDLADVAFTLDRHRKRHRFYLETSTADTGGQNLLELPYLDSPKQPKPVVLVLSGQYDTKVALDRKIYECYPAFRSYIDLCDAGVLELGYRSIRETVFQTSPIPNATCLQCSIFAVQYASARCWIDSGLRPERIVGHSFGELVALAISGALSLMDCLRLVTSRAHSIDTKWGAEKGAMIAVHNTTCNVQILVSRLNSSLKGARIEIACYNAPASTILVGTTADIERAEYLLATTAEFRDIKVQRLSTTHAFHSALTEPILSELENASDNLEWRDPEIPLETCTRDGLTFTRGWNPSTHAREPVYFVDAVQRVEKLLGSCVWLEVGFNSPIIPMIRRACASPESHYFHAMKTDAGSTSLDFIGHAISDLRRSGIHLSHWAFLGPGSRNYRKVWLPPYQFDRTAFWMENIDRVREAYELASKALPSAENPSETASSKLIQIKPHADVKSTVIDFSINPKSERFQALVRGHCLLHQPLCPASMFMEWTVMAIQNLIGNIDSKHLEFENLHFQTPLGLDPAREIDLRLENMVPDQRWKLTISSVFSQNNTNALIHCTGNISLLKRDLSVYTRLVESSIEGVRRSHDTERLKSKRAYGLFSKVMNYLPFFQGIKSLNLLESEAVAVVKFPDNQPHRDDSTVWRRCDTVLIDNFVSVVGLLLNSSGRASDTEIMISNAMDRVTLTAACKTTEPVEWLVYGAFRSTDFAQHLGDVYVCLPTGELVAMMVGVQFVKVDTTKMSKALTSANGGTPRDHSLRSIDIQAESASTMEIDSALSKSSLGAPTPCEDSTDVDIKGMISSYTGLSSDDIPHDGVLFDLGFDSLSIIEFASEIQQAYGTTLTQDQISSMTLDDLGVFLDAKSTNKNVAIKETVNTTIQENRSSNPEKQLPSVSELRVRSTEKPQEEFQENTVYTDALESLAESDAHFENTASKHGYSNYYDQILPILNSLTLAYIIEAFLSMGIDLFAYPPGSIITPVSYMPKYQKLMNRIWEILQAQGIISRHSSIIIRGRASPAMRPSATIYDALVSQFPLYIPDAKVMKLSGEGLARSLRGEQDPLALLFGTPSSSKIMDDYYATSPMVATLNDQLITFVMLLLQDRRKCGQRSFRILEIGAGTGGTTFGLANKIQAAGLACEYTFTDISGRMVSKAREKLTGYPWIKFGNLDLEKEIPDQFRNRFDVTISTNCVHATKNVLTSSRRIWETLVKHGVAVLAEGTERIDWFDLAFGQLDGWWAADDGRDHPIQKESLWTKTFQEAGFEAVGCSGGTTREAKTQQLIVGCKTSPQAGSAPDQSELYQLQTMVYKEADGLPIHADVYIPREVHKLHYPIAIIIHGGGFMMLSRKAVRIAQIRYLLSNGFLPVSIDYRLCPELNIFDGPITDVRDAYSWVQNDLNSILRSYDITIDSNRIAAIGWSTGGHLALSLAWTARQAGLTPPTAILSFYAPVDFESGALDTHSERFAPLPKLNQKEILSQLSQSPIANYNIDSLAETKDFFGLRPGDPRSDLLLLTFRQRTTLPLLLNGLEGLNKPDIPAERVAAMSPLAQVCLGNFRTPTFIIHSRSDEVVPFTAAELFVGEMKRMGIKCGFLALEGLSHLHDLDQKPGSKRWEETIQPGYEFLFDLCRN